MKVNPEINHEQFLDIKNILFPHLLVELSDWEDKKDYKDKWNKAANTRVKVLQTVIDYFNEAQRLNQDDSIWYQLVFWFFDVTFTLKQCALRHLMLGVDVFVQWCEYVCLTIGWSRVFFIM